MSKNLATDAVGGSDDPVTIKHDVNQDFSLIKILGKGLLICAMIASVDYLVLSTIDAHNPNVWLVFVAMGVFTLQTIGLSIVIGRRVGESPVWWLFFAWSLVLVNLNLMLIQFGVDWTARYLTALVFAFVTAQIGLVIFWGILDSSEFSKRSVVAGFLFVACCYPYWLISASGGGRGWLATMTAYIVSAFASCLILRVSGFRLIVPEKGSEGTLTQFSVSHLFSWTTVVALLFAGGRFVNWDSLFESGDSFASSILRAVLMTVLTVSTAWAVMGKARNLSWKLPLLIIILAAIGFGLYFLDTKSGRSSLAGFWYWRPPAAWELARLRNVWFSWTVLNGAFFSSLILVLRVSGKHLSR